MADDLAPGDVDPVIVFRGHAPNDSGQHGRTAREWFGHRTQLLEVRADALCGQGAQMMMDSRLCCAPKTATVDWAAQAEPPAIMRFGLVTAARCRDTVCFGHAGAE